MISKPNVDDAVVYRSIAGDYHDARVIAVNGDDTVDLEVNVNPARLDLTIDLHGIQWYEDGSALPKGASAKREKAE